MEETPAPMMPSGHFKQPARRKRVFVWVAGVCLALAIIGWSSYRGMHRQKQLTLYTQYQRDNAWRDTLKLDYGAIKPLITEIQQWETTIAGTPYPAVFSQIDKYSDRVASHKDRLLTGASKKDGPNIANDQCIALLDCIHAYLVAARKLMTAEQKFTLASQMAEVTRDGLNRLNEGEYSAGPLYNLYVSEFKRLRRELDEYRKKETDASEELALWQVKAEGAVSDLAKRTATIEAMLAEPRKVPPGLDLRFAELEFK